MGSTDRRLKGSGCVLTWERQGGARPVSYLCLLPEHASKRNGRANHCGGTWVSSQATQCNNGGFWNNLIRGPGRAESEISLVIYKDMLEK